MSITKSILGIGLLFKSNLIAVYKYQIGILPSFMGCGKRKNFGKKKEGI
jgi:hypothetical protein